MIKKVIVSATVLLLGCSIGFGNENMQDPENCPFTHDFEMPQYDGIDNLQFINNEWVLVVNEYWREAVKRADRLAAESEEGQELLSFKGKWGRWSWMKKWSPIHRKYLLKTYKSYKNMGDPAFFKIASTDDPSYQKPRQAEQAVRWHKQIGCYMNFHYARNRDTSSSLLGCYGYLKLPEPMKPGCNYTITQGDGRKVTFRWHEDTCVSRAIKVNQNGYSADVKQKYSYLGLWIPTIGAFDFSKWDGKPFEVMPLGGSVPVLTGKIKLKAKNPRFVKRNNKTKTKEQGGEICGEDIYELDLGGLLDAGEFYIKIPGIGRSWPFLHEKTAYGRAFYIAMRGMYQQRCGIELADAYTAWPRNACHTNAGEAAMAPTTSYMRKAGVKNLPVSDFEAIKRTGRKPPADGYTGCGGWHDAADFDRRWFHYQSVWDLLFAYELAPDYFTDWQLYIPESGNGIPDMLDEAEYGLLCWRNTQRKDGGVAGRIEQTRHTPYPEFGMPDQDPYPMFNSLRTREFSFRYAAAASQLSRLIKPFDKKKAAQWLKSAEKAYKFGKDPDNSLDIADYAGSGKSVQESEDWNKRSICFAGIEMYLATGEKSYLKDGLEHFEYTLKTMQYPFKCLMHLLPYALSEDSSIPQNIRQQARDWYLNKAEGCYKHLAEQPYPYSLPLDWPWGYAWGNGTMTNYGRWLMIAYFLSGRSEQKYLDGAALNADYMLGCNPLGVCWMSGCGYNYPTVFFDAESEMDGIDDPVPGITVYGPTGGIGMGARRHGYFYLKDFRKIQDGDAAFCPAPFDTLDELSGIPNWRRWSPDYHTDPALQEFTVWETMSPGCFTYGLLMGEGWKPGKKLKNMQPRPKKYLFGDYLTP